MSEEPRGERLFDDNRHLVAYGVGGDYIGARRSRRAFRSLVLATIALTGSLYYVEQYKRYDLNEVQYRMALTLEDDSQRAILRHVVRRDSEERDVPTAKYVEALANIEEDDVVLERFAEAAKLAPDKGSLLIVYGCKLFQQGKYLEARQVLREATLKTTRNALPKYLQAAALAASSPTEEDFRTAVALLARANDSGEQDIFPQPLWHESLPKQGNWYESLRRRLADQCSAPLYHLKNVMLNRAREDLKRGETQGWDDWLYQLQQMGERLVGTSASDPENLGASQAIYGLQIQKDALAMRIAMAKQQGGGPAADLEARQLKLEEAMTQIQRFETSRDQAVALSRRLVQQPLWLVFYGFGLLFLVSVVFRVVGKLFQTDKNARALRQTRLSVTLVTLWSAAIGLTLLALLTFNGGGESLSSQIVLGVWWYLLLISIVIFSLAYPAIVLPSPATVCQDLLAEPYYSDRLDAARRSRRKAYISVTSRLLDIALGSYTMMLCLVFLGHRIATGLYPTDVKLLIGGMEGPELALIRAVQQSLIHT